MLDKIKQMVKSNLYQVKQLTNYLKHEVEEDLHKNTFIQEIGTVQLGGRMILLMEYELIFAAMGQRDFPSAMYIVSKEIGVIWVNRRWSNSRRPIKEAILAHELGHIQSGHFDNPFKAWAISLFNAEIATNREIEADSYAKPEGMMNAIFNIKDVFFSKGISVEELDKRIKALDDKRIEEIKKKSYWNPIKRFL